MKRNQGAITYLNRKPVDSRIDNTILIERLLTVIDITAEWELWVKINDEPIIHAE